MYRAEPPNGIGIPFDGSDGILFAPHKSRYLSAASAPKAVSTSVLGAAPISAAPSGCAVIAHTIPVCVREIPASGLGMIRAADVANTVSVFVRIGASTAEIAADIARVHKAVSAPRACRKCAPYAHGCCDGDGQNS